MHALIRSSLHTLAPTLIVACTSAPADLFEASGTDSTNEASDTTAADEVSEGSEGSEGSDGMPKVEPLPPDVACGDQYLVALKPGSSCAAVAAGAGGVAGEEFALGDHSFCLMNSPVEPDAALAEAVIPDCPVVFAAGQKCSELAEVADESAKDLMHADWDDEMAYAALDSGCTGPDVIVYIVDSIEEKECLASECLSALPHAQAVIEMARVAAGPDGKCTGVRVRKAMTDGQGTVGAWLAAHAKILTEIRTERRDGVARKYMIAEPLGWQKYDSAETEALVKEKLATFAAEDVWVVAAAGNQAMSPCGADEDVVFPGRHADLGECTTDCQYAEGIIAVGAVGLDGKLSVTARPGGIVPWLAPGESFRDAGRRCGTRVGSSISVGALVGALARLRRAAPDRSLKAAAWALYSEGTSVPRRDLSGDVLADRGEQGVAAGEEARIINVCAGLESLAPSGRDCEGEGEAYSSLGAAYVQELKSSGLDFEFGPDPCIWFEVDELRDLSSMEPTAPSMCTSDPGATWTWPVTPKITCQPCRGGVTDEEVEVVLDPDTSGLPKDAECELQLKVGEKSFTQKLDIWELLLSPKLFRFALPAGAGDVLCDLVCSWPDEDGNIMESRVPVPLVEGAVLSNADLELPGCGLYHQLPDCLHEINACRPDGGLRLPIHVWP